MARAIGGVAERNARQGPVLPPAAAVEIEGGAPGAVVGYRSADSIQARYAVKRSAWLTPLFLAVLACSTAAVIASLQPVSPAYQRLLASSAGVIGLPTYIDQPLGLRPFFVLLAVLVPLFTLAPVVERVKLAVTLTVLTLAAIFVADTLMTRWSASGGPGPFDLVGQVASGFGAVAVFGIGMAAAHRFPASSTVPTLIRRPRRYLLAFLITYAITAALLFALARFADLPINHLRDFGVLGGIGPGILLLAPVSSLVRFVFSWCAYSSRRAWSGVRALAGHTTPSEVDTWLDQVVSGAVTAPTISFLVPAHNEEKIIAASILSMDRAAAHYPGTCRVVIVDNASADRTSAVAREALSQCAALSGEVLYCAEPGKSKALNMGLGRTASDIVVRVDSDTVLKEDVLPKIARHFADPTVGGVGGMPLPIDDGSINAKVRRIEVFYSVGWNRLGHRVLDSVMVVPGMLSVFRADLLRKMGGFAEGMNGEDTDMTVRVGRSGYRIVMDPSVRFYTEVPADLSHLREQRLRWSRGAFHVFMRNLSAVQMRQGVRGMVFVPLSGFGFLRRALVPAIFVYAAVAAVVDPGSISIRGGAALLAVVVGPELLLVTLALIVYGQFRSLPFVPAFFLFRFYRAYIGLEVILSLRHKSLDRVAAPERVPADSKRPRQLEPALGGTLVRSAQRSAESSYQALAAAPRRLDPSEGAD